MATRRVLSLIACLVVVGCGGGSPSARPTSPAAIATASPALTLTPTTTSTLLPPTPEPKVTPKPPRAWTELELAIRDAIRPNARVACQPRRHDLPPGTIAAVECQPDKRLVRRVGFYLFATSADAFDVYRKRIREEGLHIQVDSEFGWEQATGSCRAAALDGDVDASTCRDREAAFLNSDGYANYRALSGRLYIGALGGTRDKYALQMWAWGGNEGEGDPVKFQTLWCDGARPHSRLPLCRS